MNYKYDKIKISLCQSPWKAKKCVYDFVKRIMDIFLSLIALIITLPIMIIVSFCVMFETKGNPIFIQERVGKEGKIFNLYKIRSMYNDAEKHSGPKWADKNDGRITKVGAFIRRSRIDELPQFVNILQGDMSIVGPRPERFVFIKEFENQTPGFIKRLKVKPGLTGLAQINGGYDLDHIEKLAYDLQYIKKQSIWMDIKIIFHTVWIILSGKGAR